MAKMIECPLCRAAFALDALLAGVVGYSSGTDSACAPCPRCRAVLEFRVRSGSIELGYTYWAGSFHFEGMVTVSVSGLRRTGERSAPVFEYLGVAYPTRRSS